VSAVTTTGPVETLRVWAGARGAGTDRRRFWRFRMSRTVLLLVAALLLAPAGAMAQARLTGADVSGTVTDESGAAVPGAVVTVTSVDTNVSRTATTDTRGRYLVAALPPGAYRIAVEAKGFASA